MVARGESRGEKRGARPLAVGTPSGVVVVVLLGPALSLALTPQLVYETDCEEAAGARERTRGACDQRLQAAETAAREFGGLSSLT
jgi:hypothetical protein